MYLNKKIFAFFVLAVCLLSPFFAQTHISIPLDNQVYYILEQAELRGLCTPLPPVKPYSQQVVKNAILEILESDSKYLSTSTPQENDDRAILLETGAKRPFAALKDRERAILLETLEALEPVQGFDIHRGELYYSKNTKKKNIHMSFNLGFDWESQVGISKGMNGGGFDFGTDNWFSLFLRGDMGNAFSWSFAGQGGLIRAPIQYLGTYYPYYKGAKLESWRSNDPVEIFSDPVSAFPYTYRKKWDSSVFHSDNLSASGFFSWPQSFGFGYNLTGEISASFLDGHIFLRGGRFLREWGAESRGNSIVFNEGARPFLAIEGIFAPFSWLSFSVLTGVLEYFNKEGITVSSQTFQNAYSIALLEVGYKTFVRFKFGSNVIWPKRFELGYAYPLNSNFFYQNNIGDFDNLGLFASLSAGFPGIGKAWFSFFADEFDLSSPDFFHQDRNMFAFQTGTSIAIPIPFLPFTNFILQYTKIEPYTYTHLKLRTPWYGDLAMEEGYVNNGVGIGYYLPPNSDELKIRLETMFNRDTNIHLQYQMVRHGADYGSRAVDGSSFLSELDPVGRNEKPQLWKYFLHDGAYQWQHILKLGMNHSLSKMMIPVRLFFDVGFVWSYFTDIEGEPNSGKSFPYHIIDTSEYPKQTRVMATVGFKIWPK